MLIYQLPTPDNFNIALKVKIIAKTPLEKDVSAHVPIGSNTGINVCGSKKSSLK